MKSKDVQPPMYMKKKATPQNHRYQPQVQQQKHSNTLKQQSQARSGIDQQLLRMNLDNKYKEVLGADSSELYRYAKKKMKEKKAIEKLKQEGKIQIVKSSKQSDHSAPQGLELTEEGKLKDASGKIISLQDQARSLKINQTKQKEEKIKDINKISEQLRKSLKSKGKHFDKNIALSNSNIRRQKRKLMALNFIEMGSLAINAEIRNQQQDVENPDNVKSEQLQTSSVAFKRVFVKQKHHDPVPNIEWWDAPILPQQQGNYIPLEGDINDSEFKQPATAHTQEQILNNINFLEQLKYSDTNLVLEKLNKLIEHPKPFQVSEIVQNREKAALPTFLTKKERKKRLRKIRTDIQKDKQDKIRLGLMKPSPPKIKLQNMMKILGAEAQLDPSKAEQEVRRQIQARLDKHIEYNESRKLTKEQRGEKLKMKWQKDSAQEIRVVIFRIEDLSDPKNRFKVNMNAQQVQLQGVCLQATAQQNGQTMPSIVVAEGGPKGIKFYKKLMLNRIKWNQEDESKEGCKLVWEGIAKQRSFNKWKNIEIKSEAEGRRILFEKNCEQYWDLAINFDKQQQQQT